MDVIIKKILRRSEFGKRLLYDICVRHKFDTVFVFGSEGTPFWSSKQPLTQEDYDLLGNAIDQINSTELSRERPFIGYDPDGRFSFITQKRDLNVVIVTNYDRKRVSSAALHDLGNEIDFEIQKRAIRERSQKLHAI